MKPVRLLFDLDGTIMDTAPDLYSTLNYCLNSAGRDTVTLPSVRHMVGQGARMLLERGLLATGGLPDPARFEDLVTLFFDHYSTHLADHTVLFDGVLPALQELHRHNIPMAICTNKPLRFARPIITAFDLDRYFPVIAGGDSFDVRKPHPGHLQQTLAALPGPAGMAVMIGDTSYDINAARAAGIASIAVSFGYSEIAADRLGADRVIHHFDALLPALEALSLAGE